MYCPQHFEETRSEVLHALLRSHPLATLVRLGADGLVADHIPMLLHTTQDGAGTEQSSLHAHVARANPLWRIDALEVPVLAIFQGAQSYISPSWYPTKQEHGKVVPTWNYAVVHVHGLMRVHDDPVWVRKQITQLTQQQEANLPQPWQVDDAPRAYTDALTKAIVGLEIRITRWEGKCKVSQNQPTANQQGVAQALRSSGVSEKIEMAALVDVSAEAARGRIQL